MPSSLNNAPTTDTYAVATTVVFAYGRPSFSVQVSNAAIYYVLGYVSPSGRDVVWMPDEHFTVQALLTFNDTAGEGLPPGSVFGGVKVRSATTNIPARVTVA